MGLLCDLILEKKKQHDSVFAAIHEKSGLLKEIECAVSLVLEAVKSNHALYFCGNGGSAADAQHIATEFVSRFYRERRAINADALTVNTSALTAIANDYEFSKVFLRQLEAKGKPGDVLVGISTSGTSANVLNAMNYAVSRGMRTILLTGMSRTFEECPYDCIVCVPSTDTPRIQEMHIFIGHIMAEYVEKMMLKEWNT